MPYTYNKSFLRADFDDGSLLFNVEDHSTHTLNHTAALVIQQIIKKVPLPVIVDRIAFAFNVQPALVKKDCQKLIRELKKRRVLHETAGKK
jgi:hypothetical protein